MKRWSCPRCGVGGLAPARPARNDVRRYCLECSKTTGKLVERVCGAAERAKEKSSARTVERRAVSKVLRAIDRDAEEANLTAHFTVAGHDVRKLVPIYWRALGYVAVEHFKPRCVGWVFRHSGGFVLVRDEWMKRQPKVDVLRRTGHGDQVWGHAFGTRRCYIAVSGTPTSAAVRTTLLHELAHNARAWLTTVDPKDTSHGRTFNELMIRAAGIVFGNHVRVGFGPTGYWATKQLEKALAAYDANKKGGETPP